jgi:Cdc6-like AAA superfamily ATPase
MASRTETARQQDQKREQERTLNRQRQAVTRVFGANRPVDNRNELCGRQSELHRLTSAMCDSHMHGLIFGPRGSGKTSLARVFGDYADENGFTVIYLSCAGGEDFGELMAPYLDDLPARSFGMRQEEFSQTLAALVPSLNPRSLASLLVQIQDEQVILILDEFDRVESATVKAQVAMLAKLLSDMRSNVRLLFVGISGNVEDLIGAHASIRRHLIAISVSPLPEEDVDRFIQEASKVSGISFADPARLMIRWLARGSPYHMRLFCLRAAFAALDSGSAEVDGEAANRGVSAALADWAMVNDRDAKLFASLATANATLIPALEGLAQSAISLVDFNEGQVRTVLGGAGISPDLAPQLIEALAPSLRLLPDNEGVYTFEDALAPQFLLATCGVERQRQKAARLVAAG